MTLNKRPEVTDMAFLYRNSRLLQWTFACLIAATGQHQVPILGTANRLRLNRSTTRRSRKHLVHVVHY